MAARVRIGKRGKEQPAVVAAVSNVEGHGCKVGVHVWTTNDSLPEVFVALNPADPHVVLLTRKLLASLTSGADVEVARAGLESVVAHGIVNLRYGHYRHAEDGAFQWGNFTGEPDEIACAVVPTAENTASQEALVTALRRSMEIA